MIYFEEVHKVTKMTTGKDLFSGWDKTIILSCLQGVMGRVYVNDADDPTAAITLLGDFGFLAGQADWEFLRALKQTVCRQDFLILVPQHDGWSEAIEDCYEKNCRMVTRYAFRKEPGGFDRAKLQGLVNTLPKEYRLAMIDRRWYSWCRRTDWYKNLVSQYESYEQYAKLSLGVLILRDDVPVSGAKLILECLQRGLYPSWDAQNPWSAALAEKPGLSLFQ